MSGARIELRAAEVAVDGARLLGPLDLDVAAGEHVLVVGRSGSGKTTLLRAIAGLTPLAAGTVALDGIIATAGARVTVPPERRGVAMLFQGAALWPHLSVERTLRFVLRHAGVRGDAARARVGELLEQVELAGFERRMPGTLSGGERQRLALARALAQGPRVLLLDEPLGPLDAELRGALLGRLDALHAEHGFTILHVTHDPDEALASAARIVRLADGVAVPTETSA